jgi:hypothetical protein
MRSGRHGRPVDSPQAAARVIRETVGPMDARVSHRARPCVAGLLGCFVARLDAGGSANRLQAPVPGTRCHLGVCSVSAGANDPEGDAKVWSGAARHSRPARCSGRLRAVVPPRRARVGGDRMAPGVLLAWVGRTRVLRRVCRPSSGEACKRSATSHDRGGKRETLGQERQERPWLRRRRRRCIAQRQTDVWPAFCSWASPLPRPGRHQRQLEDHVSIFVTR